MRNTLAALLPCLLALSCSDSTTSSGGADLVVYCSLDQDLSEGILADFETRTGLKIETQFDVERNKTVGLVNRIIAEAKSNPRADVYWNNEIAHTLRLKNEGLTVAYRSPSADGIPASFVDREGHWTGFAARARVILYRTDRKGPVPNKLDDFLDPAYASGGAMAQPLTGTTLTNATALSLIRGDQEMLDWFEQAKAAGLSFGSGNADVMRRTCNGDFLWCFTDTDDAAKAMEAGNPVAIRYLEQGDGDLGAMLIPNSISILASGKNQGAAQQFVDYVLSTEVEQRLAFSVSQQIPLHEGVSMPEGIAVPGKDYQVMDVDWAAVAAAISDRADAFQEAFVK
ncbi:MAG: extracellular solute-binding protein [Planctomycetota bacterium]|jgi:iron(III) transport system substrate-binding protein|nr:extracellular solute-binding protein [Planctomycetota bacterium]